MQSQYRALHYSAPRGKKNKNKMGYSVRSVPGPKIKVEKLWNKIPISARSDNSNFFVRYLSFWPLSILFLSYLLVSIIAIEKFCSTFEFSDIVRKFSLFYAFYVRFVISLFGARSFIIFTSFYLKYCTSFFTPAPNCCLHSKDWQPHVMVCYCRIYNLRNALDAAEKMALPQSLYVTLDHNDLNW